MRMGDPWGMIYGGSGYPDLGNTAPEELADACAEKARAMYKWGVRSSRMGVCWCNVERVRGTYDWTEPDAKIPAVAGAGINVALCVATTPQWAWQYPQVEKILIEREQENLAGCMPAKPEYWPDYERYLAEVVKRYGQHLKHYELWNEPDGMAGFRFITDEKGNFRGFHHGGDPAWYAELVKRSHKVIKAIQPEARVCIGSYEKKSAMPPLDLAPALAETLNKGELSEELRKAFAAAPDAPLSPSAVVWIKQNDKKWVINDDRNGRRFTITHNGDTLHVTDDKTWFIECLYEHGIKGHYDAMSIHPYGNPFGREWLATVRRVMVEYGEGDKPLWVNEYSLHGRGVELAFNTRRQLRLLRETPWISAAQPLVFACHFDKDICPFQRSLRAHRQMSEEYAPRGEFTADFERSILKLLDNWEWLVTGPNSPQAEIRSDYPHSGQACLVAKTDDKTIRIWFTPYVKASDAVFSGHMLVESKEKDPKLLVSVGIESGDITQPIREARFWRTDWPVSKWEPFTFPIHEHFPEWKDLAVVTCYLEIQSDKMGLTVSLDDVHVGSRATKGQP